MVLIYVGPKVIRPGCFCIRHSSSKNVWENDIFLLLLTYGLKIFWSDKHFMQSQHNYYRILQANKKIVVIFELQIYKSVFKIELCIREESEPQGEALAAKVFPRHLSANLERIVLVMWIIRKLPWRSNGWLLTLYQFNKFSTFVIYTLPHKNLF